MTGASIPSYGVVLSPECIKAPMRPIRSTSEVDESEKLGCVPQADAAAEQGASLGAVHTKVMKHMSELSPVVNMTLCMLVNLMSIHGGLVISRTEQIVNIYQNIPGFPKSDCRVEQEMKEKF